MYNLKAKINFPFFEDACFITIYEKEGSDLYIARPVELIFDLQKKGEYLKEPTLKIFGTATGSLLSSLAEELSKNKIKPESDSKLIGTLDATKYHLEDLRRLLKLTKVTN
jgi:hypothetical protein